MGLTPFSNRTIRENNFETYDDGEYKVDGIEDFFSLDDSRTPPLPVFSPQGENIVAKFHLRLADRSKQGPAMSADHNQLLLLVKAFGGDVKELPEGDTTGFLLAAQERANAGGQVQTAKVRGGKGWVKSVTGCLPDVDKMYTWQFEKAISIDGSEPVRFIEKTFNSKRGGTYTQSIVYFLFKIVGDMYGRPSPFNGYTLFMNIVNPFEGEVSSVVAERFAKFISLYCPHTDPDTGNWAWTNDPEKSPYGTDETQNPLAVFVGEAQKSKRLAVAFFHTKDNYPKVDIKEWVQSEVNSVVDVDKRKQEESSQPWQLVELVELLDEVVSEKVGVKAFVDTPKDSNMILLDWTPEGLSWAKENLAGLWDSAKLPLFEGKRVLGKLSGGELATLDSVVRKTFGKEKKSVNEALTESGSF
jgi:hypothetical protein